MKRRLSLAKRTFLIAFLPMAFTLIGSFIAINQAVEGRIKNRLRDSLRRTEAILSEWDAEFNRNSEQVLSVFAENASLKAAVRLVRDSGTEDQQAGAVETVAGQLSDMGRSLDYDLLLLEDSLGRPVVGLIGPNRARLSPGSSRVEELSTALFRIEGTLYETVTVPVDLNDQSLGSLTLGKQFETNNWNNFGQTILFVFGSDDVLYTTFKTEIADEVVGEWHSRCEDTECEIGIMGETYLALPVRRRSLGEQVRLVSFQSVDQAAGEFTRSLAGVFPVIGGGGVLVFLLLSAICSRSVARPVVNLISHLKHEEHRGGFPSYLPSDYEAAEVNVLAREFTRAAGAVRESERRLDEATEQFIESMSQAQDARDPHTAGHSERVSVQSVAIARFMGLSSEEIETIRIGARLHDLGKIGIPDAVLRKPARLTRDEFILIQRHPRIGREILEKVGTFERFLPIVELHHENPDGSGYPYGLKEPEIPMAVRIVHVADVYDAITSDRAYRKAMTDGQAWDLLLNGMGTLFDPDVVEALWAIVGRGTFIGKPAEKARMHDNDAAFYSLPTSW